MRSMRNLRPLLTGAVLALLVVAPGCGGAPAQTYETVAEGVLKAGDAVPSPTGEPVFEIGGKIGAANDGASLQLDLATLEQLGLVRYTVKDPWLRRDVTYTGVLVSDLVHLLQPADSATTLHLTAFDDYEVDIPLADAERWPIMLATRFDGKRMPIGNGGPTRIVFPFGLVDGIDEIATKDLWIWNIETITVR